MLFKAVVLAAVGLVSSVAMAGAEEGAAPVVDVTIAGDQVVKVNTGNDTVDAVANLAAKCAERTAAFKACDNAGGFKAMGCRKLAEVRYKNVAAEDCPEL